MKDPASEKLGIIRLVEQSHLLIKQTLDKLGIARTTFYCWYDRYQIGGPEDSVYRLLKFLDLITSPAFIVIKAANEFKDKTTAINQLWQTDLHIPEGSSVGAIQPKLNS